MEVLTIHERWLIALTVDLHHAAQRQNKRGFSSVLDQIEEHVDFKQVNPLILEMYSKAVSLINAI